MTQRVDNLIAKLLRTLDRRYVVNHALKCVGPVLMLGKCHYKGARRRFADGTELAPRDVIGLLHFNNIHISELAGDADMIARHGFARLFRRSLQQLAHEAVADQQLREVEVFCGLTWLAPHGARVGFESEPLQRGMHRWFLTHYFRWLRWCFSPSRKGRHATLEPRQFWITRTALIGSFGTHDARSPGEC